LLETVVSSNSILRAPTCSQKLSCQVLISLSFSQFNLEIRYLAIACKV
jgi:hypothetical protein